MNKRKALSLKWQLVALVVSCWLIPIAAVAAIFGSLLTQSYRSSLQQEIETNVQNAMDQLSIRLSAAIEDSKGVSYDGIIRSIYRSYQIDGDQAELYRRINEYLQQNFSKDEKYQAVFISFYDLDVQPYVITSSIPEYLTARNYRESVRPELMQSMKNEDTAIRFFLIGDEVYMARNLLDGRFVPYAAVVMMCAKDVLFRSVYSLPSNLLAELKIDGELILPSQSDMSESEHHLVRYESEVDRHVIEINAAYDRFNIWKDVPTLKFGILAAAALGIPFLLIAVLFFYRQVTKPTNTLLKANEKLRRGERGYQITEIPGNEEFRQLTTQFNTTSTELKNQFEQIYLEQQALQQARIKTLQSQINPHFLNNTLEVINWEARMAENEKVSSMIEALSTMLDAALDRNNRGMIPLAQEIQYVDAYLYIIHERLGDRFRTEKQIDADVENVLIPRLILQPIVENAVEHDITPRGGGSICVRVCRQDGNILLETVHTGSLTAEDKANISRILETALTGSETTIGLQNVIQRLHLIYGENAAFTCEESDGLIHMRITFPER